MYDYDIVVIGAGSAGLTACKLAVLVKRSSDHRKTAEMAMIVL
ncbi:MAG: hypothetical protein ACYSSI_13310 [Planctomycetota bacterium]|jgi:pyruvate/2-oxoglutarate dehydrogenase complex dihydrolipoamide dehydrogenase (E3) component